MAQEIILIRSNHLEHHPPSAIHCIIYHYLLVHWHCDHYYQCNLLLLSGGSLAAAKICLCSSSYNKQCMHIRLILTRLTIFSVHMHAPVLYMEWSKYIFITVCTCNTVDNDLLLILVDEVVPTLMMRCFITCHMSWCVIEVPVAWSILYMCLLILEKQPRWQ